MSIDKKEILEAKSQSNINLSIDNAYTEDIVVKLRFEGTASNSDYKFIGADSAVISAGSTSSSVTIETIDDIIIEENENLIVAIDDVDKAFEAGVQQDTITILDNDSLLTISSSIDQVLCYGDENGEIILTVTQGNSPYSFVWQKDGVNLSVDNDTLDNLSPGTYSVEVRDADGKYPTSQEFIIDQPDKLQINIDDFKNVSCDEENDGKIDVTISGGNGPYTLLWSSLDVDGFSSSLEDISGLSVGEYNLKVTDANGCVETISKKLDNSGRKSINSEWFVKDKFFTTVKSDETMSQDVNNIYSVSFINDNDGIAVGEYGAFRTTSYHIN